MKIAFPVHKRFLSALVAICFTVTSFTVPAAAAQNPTFSNTSVQTGTSADCAAYNPDTHWIYVLNDLDKIISIMKPSGDSFVKDSSVPLNNLLDQVPSLSGGTPTALAVDTLRDVIAISVKSADNMKPGGIILTDYAGNFIKEFPTGVQPDKIFVSPDQEYILTTDKGAPDPVSQGDPKGSVTELDLGRGITEASSKVVTFDKFADDDDSFFQSSFYESYMIKMRGKSLSVDLEPTSLCVAGGNAYVTCEKNNAIATLDLSAGTFTAVTGLGCKDSSIPVDVLTNKPGNANPNIYDSGNYNTCCPYMPNGIAAFTEGGTTYLVTANEGAIDDMKAEGAINSVPAQAFGIPGDDYENIAILDLSKVNIKYMSNHPLLGTRSVSVWNAATMQQVGDTGAQLDEKLKQNYPDAYNRSTAAGTKPDAWSCRNGPAPNTVSIAESGGVPYAYVGLKAGGVAAINLSDAANPSFDTFTDTRSNSDPCSSDSLSIVPAEDSPSGNMLLLQTSGNGDQLYVSKDEHSVSTDRSIDIICTNDMHGSLATVKNSAGNVQTIGSDYVAGLKRDDPGSLLLDAGDATQGSSLATLTQGADVIRLMNAAGYDAMACGNHEFDYGQSQLLSNAQRAEFPILSANSIKNGNPFFKGTPYLGGAMPNNGSYVIKYAKGMKIGILGITTPETAFKTNPNGTQGIDFSQNDLTAFSAVVQNNIDALKNNEHPDVVIGVMHVGDDPSSTVTAKGIIAHTSGLNLLVDGHSHQVENETVNDANTNPVALVQTGSHSSQVDQVTLHYDASSHKISCNPNSDVSAYTGGNIGSSTDPVSSVAQMASDIVAGQAVQLKRVVGGTKTTLWGGTINNINEARLGETNLGCLITDAMTWKAKQLITSDTYKNLPIVALENGGGVRATVQAGSITVGDVLNILPFGNTIAFKEVTPAQLYAIAENGVSKVVSQDTATGQIAGADGRFPQISGFKFSYDPRNAAGSRVSSITLSNGTKIARSDTSTKLVLVSNDFEIAGGDGYDILKGLPSVGEGGGLDTVLEDYMQSLGGTVNVPVSLNRVTCEGGYTPRPYTAAVLVMLNNAPVANTLVNYQVDGGAILSGTTDANGTIKLSSLSDGPHAVKIGDAGDVLVNNYSGAGTFTSVTAQAVSTVSIAGGNSGNGNNGNGNNGGNSNNGSSGKSSSGTQTSSTKPAGVSSGIAIVQSSSEGVHATVTLQPDTPPVVNGDTCTISTTVPANISSAIGSATVQIPLLVALNSPTDAILAQMQNPAAHAISLTIQAPSILLNQTGAVRVSIPLNATVLQAARSSHKDVTVTVKDAQTGAVAFSWTFHGGSWTPCPTPETGVDLSVTVSSIQNSSTSAAVLAAAGSTAGEALHFADNGLLPATATVQVPVGTQSGIAAGSEAYLYYCNPTIGALQQVGRFPVDAQGYASLSIVHNSDYVLLPKPATKAYPVHCDTTEPVALKKGKSYTFAVTSDGNAVPALSVGNAKAFTWRVKQQGKKYFFTITAAGTPGTMTALYSRVQKQKAAVLCYIRIV